MTESPAIRSSLRNRLIKLFAGYTLLVCLCFVALLFAYAWMVEDNVFNRIVAAEAEYIRDAFELNGEIVSPRSPFLTLHDDWADLPETFYQQHLGDPDRIEFEHPELGTWYVREFEVDDQQLLLAAEVSGFAVGKLYFPYAGTSLIIFSLLLVSSALLLAVWFARLAIRPLRKLAQQVSQQQDSGQPASFSSDYPENELGFLARTIENSINHNRRLLQRESAFTRDVSHELRTPISILKNISQAGGPQLSEQQQADFAAAVRALEKNVTTLLALAREESSELETLDLLHQVEDAVVAHRELEQRPEFSLSIDVPPGYMVSANRQLLAILLNNLVGNSLHHSDGNGLEIRLCGDRLSFINQATTYIDKPLEPGQKGAHSQGLGLGLDLVKRICEVFSWSAEVESTGERFVVNIELAQVGQRH